MTARVQRDRADVDAGALARLVVAADVEHHLVGVDVRVVVGHRDRLLVVVDLARAEVADHEVGALEDLVHRRRLVDLAGDRHEVLDVERVGVEAAVPADHVERVRRVGDPGADQAGGAVASVLDQHLHVGATLDERFDRAEQVALAVRRVLQELAEPGEVALRRGDVAVRLDRVEPGDLAVDVAGDPAMGGGTRDHDVVTGAVGQHSEGGLHGAGAVLDVHALVAHGVAVVGARTVGDGVADPDVAVAQHQPPAGDRVATHGHVMELEVPRLERVVRCGPEVGQLPHLAVDDRRRDALRGRAARSRRRTPPPPSAPRSGARPARRGKPCVGCAGWRPRIGSKPPRQPAPR